MAKIRFKKFATGYDAEVFLNGGLVLQLPPNSGMQKMRGLVGKTLIFTQPSSVTVTFAEDSPGSGPDLTLLQALAQIRAAIPALQTPIHSMGEGVVLIEVAPANGVTLTGAGTANSYFGLTAAGAATVVYDPPASPAVAPCYLNMFGTGNGQYEIVIYDEVP